MEHFDIYPTNSDDALTIDEIANMAPKAIESEFGNDLLKIETSKSFQLLKREGSPIANDPKLGENVSINGQLMTCVRSHKSKDLSYWFVPADRVMQKN